MRFRYSSQCPAAKAHVSLRNAKTRQGHHCLYTRRRDIYKYLNHKLDLYDYVSKANVFNFAFMHLYLLMPCCHLLGKG